jgi:hypothetical protein
MSRCARTASAMTTTQGFGGGSFLSVCHAIGLPQRGNIAQTDGPSAVAAVGKSVKRRKGGRRSSHQSSLFNRLCHVLCNSANPLPILNSRSFFWLCLDGFCASSFALTWYYFCLDCRVHPCNSSFDASCPTLPSRILVLVQSILLMGRLNDICQSILLP